jgi:hypothetical protein
MEVTIAQGCVSGDGRGNGNMRLPCFPGSPRAFVYGVRGRTGKGGGFQVPGAAHRV